MTRHLATLLFFAVVTFAQTSADFAQHFSNEYRVTPNVTYVTATGEAQKLDVYRKLNVTTPQPTLIYMHGGFWVAGNKEAAITSIMPFLEMGWNVVNVEYRLGAQALAPAALEDCLCALRWVAQPAQLMTYNIDPDEDRGDG